MKPVFVRVRMNDSDRTLEWRTFEVETLDEAVKMAESQDGVEVVLEASWFPGGVMT